MTIITGVNTELPAYNSATERTFSRIHGRPSRCNRDTLHKELENIVIYVGVPCFKWYGAYGLLAEARTATACSNLTHLAYVDPGDVETEMTNPDVTDATSAFKKEKQKAKWNGMRTSWYTRRSALCAICKNIQDALNDAYKQAARG